MSPKFVFGYTILVSLVRFFCGPLKGRTPFRIHFRGECCQNYKLHFVAKFFVRFVDFNFVQCFPDSVLLVWFLKSLVKKNKLGKTAVLDTYFCRRCLFWSFVFCNNVFSVKCLLWRSTGTLNCRFILFLIISFGRFQYFNLHFGSLKLCFTNLVLVIQDNLSLIFLSSLEISNLIYFTHFRLSPIIMGHISKIQAQVCPICQNLIQSKTIRL